MGQNIVIVGGGTAGWMTAAAFSEKLDHTSTTITLIESDAIGTVGVGEATVPHLRFFNELLGLDEREFMRATQATYKLGIEFVHWGQVGEHYLHPFGVYGEPAHGVNFFQSWLRARAMGDPTPLEAYAPGAVMARLDRFQYPGSDGTSFGQKFSYAFHLDASRYASYLRHYSEARGVVRKEGQVEQVERDHDSGAIKAVHLEDGTHIGGDLFIDCSGFRALLNGKTLKTPYRDWRHWLPCDRAVAIPCAGAEPPRPYTRAIAHQAGWRWQIPLQHRTGNGLVYCSDYLSPEGAETQLLSDLEGEPLAQPNHLQFTTGVRERSWSYNSIAIGLSSGFLEPLESTSIYLIQAAIMNLLECLPRENESSSPLLRDEFNRRMTLEYERVRDFLVLHYTATRRSDSPFWERMRTLKKPESLQRKMSLFLEQGQVEHYERGMFLEPSWLAVYEGQGLLPRRCHASVFALDEASVAHRLQRLRLEVEQWAKRQQTHESALAGLTASEDEYSPAWPPAAMSLYGVFS